VAQSHLSDVSGALPRAYEQHKYGPQPHAPYAGGGMRALPEPTRRRRQALAKVRERWPDVTSSQIFTTFGDHGVQRGGLPRTPGGYLRRLLAREAPGEIVRRPSKSTLHEDLKALRAASRDQKPQHPGRGRPARSASTASTTGRTGRSSSTGRRPGPSSARRSARPSAPCSGSSGSGSTCCCAAPQADAKDGPGSGICCCSGTGWPGVTTAVAT
jgi:hypothetical protein